jgi:hypothetical protein
MPPATALHARREWSRPQRPLARIANRKGRVARYRGVRKNLFDLRRAATIQNLEALFVIHKLVA